MIFPVLGSWHSYQPSPAVSGMGGGGGSLMISNSLESVHRAPEVPVNSQSRHWILTILWSFGVSAYLRGAEFNTYSAPVRMRFPFASIRVSKDPFENQPVSVSSPQTAQVVRFARYVRTR